jgi:hypothetical protein
MTDNDSVPRSPSLRSPPDSPPFPPTLTLPEVNDPLPFDEHFVPYGPAVWSPYLPHTLSPHLPDIQPSQDTDQIFRSQGLPHHLLALGERDKIAIAYGFEERRILWAQAELARGCHRQGLLLSRIQELDMEVESQQQMRRLNRALDVSVIEALQKILVCFPPEPAPRESGTPDLRMSGKGFYAGQISFP